jgi:hypothetical protein
MNGAISPLPKYALMVWCSVKNAQEQLYLYLLPFHLSVNMNYSYSDFKLSEAASHSQLYVTESECYSQSITEEKLCVIWIRRLHSSRMRNAYNIVDVKPEWKRTRKT